MFPTDKQIANLVKKLSGKTPQKQKKVVIEKDQYDENINRASADDIFREMKKLPFSS